MAVTAGGTSDAGSIDDLGGGIEAHVFTADGTFTPTDTGDIEALIVAGGGGGGARQGGGGGGGETKRITIPVTSGVPLSVTVGTGGAGGGSHGAGGDALAYGLKGGDSSVLDGPPVPVLEVPAIDERVPTPYKQSNGSYNTFTFDVTVSRRIRLNSVVVEVLGGTGLTWSLTVDGGAYGTGQVAPASDGDVTFTDSLVLEEGTYEFVVSATGTANVRFDDTGGPQNLGVITVGDWQEASNNTCPIGFNFNTYTSDPQVCEGGGGGGARGSNRERGEDGGNGGGGGADNSVSTTNPGGVGVQHDGGRGDSSYSDTGGGGGGGAGEDGADAAPAGGTSNGGDGLFYADLTAYGDGGWFGGGGAGGGLNSTLGWDGIGGQGGGGDGVAATTPLQGFHGTDGTGGGGGGVRERVSDGGRGGDGGDGIVIILASGVQEFDYLVGIRP